MCFIDLDFMNALRGDVSSVGGEGASGAVDAVLQVRVRGLLRRAA